MRNVNLSGANLSGAILDKVDLSGAHLRGAVLTSVSLEGADLRRAQLDGASLKDAILRDANLVGASLHGGDLSGVKWNDRTRWPVEYIDRIRSSSQELFPGEYVVVSDADRSPLLI